LLTPLARDEKVRLDVSRARESTREYENRTY